MKKIFCVLVFLVVLFVGLALGVLFIWFPAVGAPSAVVVEITPERLERGRYLADHVTMCTDCHSHRDTSRFAGPVVSGTHGRGGEVFDHSMGVPGTLVASNITPFALASWSDGEIVRAISEGVSRDGRPLFPLMPYLAYRELSSEDLYSIVAWLRSLEPIESVPPASRLDFPVNLVVRTLPRPATLGSGPPADDLLEQGRYLTTIADCAACHTPHAGGGPDPGRLFQGGQEFPFGGSVTVSPNLTPDPDTGLGNWTEEQFVARFKMYDGEEGRNLSPQAMGFNTPMPWTMYAGMKEEDLRAIYTYLRSLPPVRAAHPAPRWLGEEQ